MISLGELPLRIRRIVQPHTGQAVFLSFTAGMQLGIGPEMADLPAMVGTLAETGPLTGAIVHAGVVRSILERNPGLPCGLIVDLFGGTWLTSFPDRREQICSLEHAVRVGADAVLGTISLGSDQEAHQLGLCGKISRECASWGLPFIIQIDTLATNASRQFSASLSGHGARVAYELGADMVIVNFTDPAELFPEVLQGVSIPVLIGGGPRMATDEDLLDTLSQAVRAGAAGAAMPATLFWHGEPATLWHSMAGALTAGTPAAH